MRSTSRDSRRVGEVRAAVVRERRGPHAGQRRLGRALAGSSDADRVVKEDETSGVRGARRSRGPGTQNRKFAPRAKPPKLTLSISLSPPVL